MLKFYPNQKKQDLRYKIMHFTQDPDEPFHEAWERFKGFLQQCHSFGEEVLQQFFYEGLNPTSQNLVDSTAGWDVTEKTITQAREIFETVTKSSQRKSSGPRKEASIVSMNP